MAKRDQLDSIDDSINDIAESLDCICKLIEVLLAGPSMLSSEQRVTLRHLLQDEHPHG